MTERGLVSAVFLVFLVLCASLANAAITTESMSNIVLQWGNAKALGVGPYAVGDFPIPVTPSGVYEELVNGLPVIPLDASSYLHASNGAMYMVIATDTTGPERLNRFFVAGMAASGLNITYPTPVEVTSLMGCTTSGKCLATGAQIVDFEILDEMLAFLVVWPSSPNVAEAITMAFMNASVSDFPIGRDESSGPLSKPGVVSSLLFTDISSLDLACGLSYCIATNRSVITLWAVPTSPLAAFEPTLTKLNTLLIPLAHSFMVAYSKDFYAYGPNDHGLFGGCASVADACLPFSCPVGNVLDASCSESHCLARCGNRVYPWGDNSQGQTVPSGPPTFTTFNSYSFLCSGNCLSVGAVGCSSYILSADGTFYVLGCNMVEYTDSDAYRESNLYGDAWHGEASQYRIWNKSNLKVMNIPTYFDLAAAPKLSTMSKFGKAPRAIHVPARISIPNFNKLASRKVGLSSLDKTYAPGSQGLLTWGAGYNSENGIPFANRSTNAAAVYAGAPLIMEISDLLGTFRSVSANQKSAIFHTDTTTRNLYAWGRMLEPGYSYGPTFEPAGAIKLSPSVSNPVRVDNLAGSASKFYGSCSAEQFSCASWQYSSSLILNCWGMAYQADMAAGEAYRPSAFVSINVLSDDWVDMSCGQHFCSLRVSSSTNDLWVWSLPGPDSDARSDHPWLGLGPSPPVDLEAPKSVPLNLGSGENILSVTHGYLFTIVATDTSVYAFGVNGGTFGDHDLEVWGVLGASDVDLVYNSSTIIFTQPLSMVAAGRGHVLGLHNGVVSSWGLNNFGQLGRTTNQPWQIGDVTMPYGTVAKVAAVSYTSYAILNDGSVFAWGANGLNRMFGDPLLSHLGHSNVPLAVGLNRALGLNFQVSNIHSSSFLNAVLATGTFGSGAAPSNPPTLRERLNWFGVRGYQTCGYDSLTAPGSVFRHNEELLPQFEVDEVIVGAEKSLQYGILWTNYSRVYTTGGLQVHVLSNASFPGYPNNFACAPTMVYESSSGSPSILKVTLHTSGFLIHFADGSVKIVNLLGTSDYTSLSQSYLNVDCTPFTCALENSNHTLTFFGTDFTHISQYDNLVTVSGPYAMSSSNTLVAVLNYQLNFHNMSASSTRDVTGEFPMGTAQVHKLVASHDHFLVLGNNGLLYGFGNSSFGKLPFDCSDFKSIFVAELGNAQIVDISVTVYTSFAISTNGEVYAWGYVPSEGPNLARPITTDMFTNAYVALHTYLSPTKLRIPTTTGVSGTKFIANDNFIDQAKPEGISHWAWNSYVSVAMPPYTQPPPSAQSPSAQSPSAQSPIQAPIAFPPSSVNLPPLELPGPACPPPPTAGNWACDPATGTLYLAGSLQMSPDAPLTLEGPIVIIGDFSIPPGSSLSIKLKSDIFSATTASTGQKRFVNEVMGVTPSPATNEPMVTVSGCAEIDAPIALDPDEKAVKEIKKAGEKGKTINVVKSSCTQTPGQLLVEGGADSKKGCRKYAAQQQETKSNDGTVTLSAVMVVYHDSCNHWWIILVCVLAVLAVAALVALVILRVPTLRNKLLPYRDAKF